MITIEVETRFPDEQEQQEMKLDYVVITKAYKLFGVTILRTSRHIVNPNWGHGIIDSAK